MHLNGILSKTQTTLSACCRRQSFFYTFLLTTGLKNKLGLIINFAKTEQEELFNKSFQEYLDCKRKDCSVYNKGLEATPHFFMFSRKFGNTCSSLLTPEWEKST